MSRLRFPNGSYIDMAQSTAQLECAAWEAGRGVTFVRAPTTMLG